MGLVFVAEQQQPVRRRVALKVIKPGMDTREVIARFEAERQALALMDHPHIAKVLDAGATDRGRPFFVMELVKGDPITQFCDQNRLAPARLELFVSVCQAVQHAHQKGIIHRDVKPSNVLVASHDGTPVVKVIDFGVAKAVGQQLTEKTVYTGFSQMVGTPLYMSPEQAGQSGLDIDTRTDIYALGVLLYELLTGTTPFDKERFKKAAYDEIRRIIREEEPPKPSTRLSESKDSLPSISAQRHTEPAKLTRLVRGELDWIVMKCLEKDRNRRYETASAFAADVQRYLNDEPVLACPPPAWYRLRKFARRNKVVLATASALAGAVLLAVGSLASAVRVLANTNTQITNEQNQTKEALDRETRAKEDLELALYFQRIALAERELAQQHRPGRGVARRVPVSPPRLGVALPQAAPLPFTAHLPGAQQLGHGRGGQPRWQAGRLGECGALQHDGRDQALGPGDRRGTPHPAGPRRPRRRGGVQPRRQAPGLGGLGRDRQGLGRRHGQGAPHPQGPQRPCAQRRLHPGRQAPGHGGLGQHSQNLGRGDRK